MNIYAAKQLVVYVIRESVFRWHEKMYLLKMP